MSSGVTLELVRLVHAEPLDGQLGDLRCNGEHICYTVEELWRGNQRKVSCIPAGTYALQRHWRRIADEVALALQAVPGRTGVLIHVGNSVADIEGCIAVGTQMATENGKARVLHSKDAMRRVASMNPSRIVISWAKGSAPSPADMEPA